MLALRVLVLGLFAGLPVSAVPASAQDSASSPLQEKSFEKEIKVTVKLNYLLSLPEGYDKGNQAWPLVLFLHGAGESGRELAKVKMHGPPKLVAGGKKFPFILVAPQSPGMGWNPDALNALLDDVMAKYRVDHDRVYLTGLSMGGGGAWTLAAAHPEKFAAVAPICGAFRSPEGPKAMAEKLKGLPIWVFHGAKDNVVPIARSEEMVNALKDLGADVKFTVYPEAEHDSWTETYDNPEFYEWLLKHTRRPANAGKN